MVNILIKRISETLLNEEVVCFPTETVMGLAVIANNMDTYNKLVDLKNRPANKVFPVCMLKKDISKYCKINEKQLKIINRFLPGPLTIILNKLESTPSYMGNDLGTIAIRVTEDLFLTTILEYIRKPLFLTSANLSTEPVAKDSTEAMKIFKDKVSLYIEGRPTGEIASTIVDLTKEKPAILRKGPILEKDILRVWEEK